MYSLTSDGGKVLMGLIDGSDMLFVGRGMMGGRGGGGGLFRIGYEVAGGGELGGLHSNLRKYQQRQRRGLGGFVGALGLGGGREGRM